MNYQKQTDAPVIASDAPINQIGFGGKDTKFNRQFQIVYDAFAEMPKTMMQVSVETNIMRSNITRYLSVMKRQGTIRLIEKGICPITRMSNVGFYMTVANVQPAPYIPAPIDSPIRLSCPTPKPSASAFDELRKTGDYYYQLF